MSCPHCAAPLQDIEYEGVRIRTCTGCGGEFVASEALGHIVRTREERFPGVDAALLQSMKPVFGVPPSDRERVLSCPDCQEAMTVTNYGGDSGVLVDRCGHCGGVWLDHDELEHIQLLMERWADEAPGQIDAIRPELEVARRAAGEAVSNAFTGSRFSFVNALVNRFLDAA